MYLLSHNFILFQWWQLFICTNKYLIFTALCDTSQKKICKPNKMFFCGAMCPNFLFGTCDHPIYTFYTKYISGIENNESVSLYTKGNGRWQRNNNSTEGKMEVRPFTKQELILRGINACLHIKIIPYFGKYNESTEIWKSFMENKPSRIKGTK